MGKIAQEKLVKSATLLKAAIPLMSRLDIPITPENYAVWYEYSLGTTLPLNLRIDELLRRGATFTRKINHELYMSFIANQCMEMLESSQDETRCVIHTLLDKIKGMQSGADHFSTALESCRERLESKPDLSLVTELVANLIDETKQIKAANRVMENSLSALGRVVESLKADMKSLALAATTDQLTGLQNRRAFDQVMEDLLAMYQNEGQIFSLLMVDIDHFKAFNDTYGHSVGDKVLSFVASALKDGVKGGDAVARYGGEEFAVFLPATEYAGAMAAGENVRKNIAKKHLTLSDKQKKLGNITVSIGVSMVRPGDDALLLMGRADQALYRAKSAGRNHVLGERDL